MVWFRRRRVLDPSFCPSRAPVAGGLSGELYVRPYGRDSSSSILFARDFAITLLAQLQTVARQNGIDWRHVGTSHCVFVRADGKTLPVPARRPIKPIYVKKFLELVEGA